MADLADFVADVMGSSAIRVEENYGDGFVRLVVDEAERRQAKHDIRCVEDAVIEMLRNARDAGARNIFVAASRSDDVRTLVMIDDGCGVPDSMRERIFDARVTSKLDTVHTDRWGVHGRGMALFSIKQNVDVAEVVTSGPGLGTDLRVVADVTQLPERKDQSTWPVCGKDEDGRRTVVRGPHNIVRACAEFALEERGVVDVYLGSPAEIVATMRARARAAVDETSLLFVDDPSGLPAYQRVLVPADARELVAVAASLGLPISERTAHRILGGAIKPVRSVFSRVTRKPDGSEPDKPIDLEKDRRGLKVSQDDVEEFSRVMERAFDFLGERYYLSLADAPRVKVSGNTVKVTFELDKGMEG